MGWWAIKCELLRSGRESRQIASDNIPLLVQDQVVNSEDLNMRNGVSLQADMWKCGELKLRSTLKDG